MGACCSDTAGGQQAAGGIRSNGDMDSQGDVIETVGLLGGAHGLTSQIQLSISASKLRNKDLLSKSDPMLVCYAKKRNEATEEVGRTEVILNTLNPVWVRELRLDYNFEEVQPLLLKVYDVDTTFHGVSTENLQLQEQDFLGQMECTLSEIVTAPNQAITRALKGHKEPTRVHDWGFLTIHAEEMVKSKSLVEMVIRCTELDNKDLFSKSDPFLRISRLREDGNAIPVYKTEVKMNNLNPTWKPIQINLQQLCNGDMERPLCGSALTIAAMASITSWGKLRESCSYIIAEISRALWGVFQDRPLRIECFNFNNNGSHDLIGSTQVSLNELLLLAEKHRSQDLIRPSNNRYNKQQALPKAGGKLHVDSCTITPCDSFLDYVFGGCEISFFVAVDFTASNGNPLNQDSCIILIHQAIRAVGEVIQFYDTDKRFPCWGFGGRPIDGPVSHCFALNGNQSDAEVEGVEGILRAYMQALRNVSLAGPTLFAPVINLAASMASQFVSQEPQKYFVLLIITDGVITDLQQTTLAIVNASELPLSLLIVGVGGADFTGMEILDADKRRLATADGRLAMRDIVQFVPMRNVTNGPSLAKMLLAELPGQLLNFMKSKRIVPNRTRLPLGPGPFVT